MNLFHQENNNELKTIDIMANVTRKKIKEHIKRNFTKNKVDYNHKKCIIFKNVGDNTPLVINVPLKTIYDGWLGEDIQIYDLEGTYVYAEPPEYEKSIFSDDIIEPFCGILQKVPSREQYYVESGKFHTKTNSRGVWQMASIKLFITPIQNEQALSIYWETEEDFPQA